MISDSDLNLSFHKSRETWEVGGLLNRFLTPLYLPSVIWFSSVYSLHIQHGYANTSVIHAVSLCVHMQLLEGGLDKRLLLPVVVGAKIDGKIPHWAKVWELHVVVYTGIYVCTVFVWEWKKMYFQLLISLSFIQMHALTHVYTHMHTHTHTHTHPHTHTHTHTPTHTHTHTHTHKAY